MTSFTDTLREGLQYRGESGQWPWIFHRVSGLLTVAFIVTHVLDSTLITFFPKLYQKTIKLFKNPLSGFELYTRLIGSHAQDHQIWGDQRFSNYGGIVFVVCHLSLSRSVTG